jgi:hypothetical protein
MRPIVVSLLVILLVTACVARMSAVPDDPRALHDTDTVAIGRVITVLVGPSNRWYEPELRFFEVVHRATGHRTQVMIEGADKWFVIPLLPGDYDLSRVQVSEGAFRGMAKVGVSFSVAANGATYVGTWQLGVDTPQYNRTVILSAVQEPLQDVADHLRLYPALRDRPVQSRLPTPAVAEARLFEISPYPTIWWFRRHQTS